MNRFTELIRHGREQAAIGSVIYADQVAAQRREELSAVAKQRAALVASNEEVRQEYRRFPSTPPSSVEGFDDSDINLCAEFIDAMRSEGFPRITRLVSVEIEYARGLLPLSSPEGYKRGWAKFAGQVAIKREIARGYPLGQAHFGKREWRPLFLCTDGDLRSTYQNKVSPPTRDNIGWEVRSGVAAAPAESRLLSFGETIARRETVNCRPSDSYSYGDPGGPSSYVHTVYEWKAVPLEQRLLQLTTSVAQPA